MHGSSSSPVRVRATHVEWGWHLLDEAQSREVAGAAKVYVCFRMIRLEVEAFERHKGINLVRRGAAKS